MAWGTKDHKSIELGECQCLSNDVPDIPSKIEKKKSSLLFSMVYVCLSMAILPDTPRDTYLTNQHLHGICLSVKGHLIVTPLWVGKKCKTFSLDGVAMNVNWHSWHSYSKAKIFDNSTSTCYMSVCQHPFECDTPVGGVKMLKTFSFDRVPWNVNWPSWHSN